MIIKELEKQLNQKSFKAEEMEKIAHSKKNKIAYLKNQDGKIFEQYLTILKYLPEQKFMKKAHIK